MNSKPEPSNSELMAEIVSLKQMVAEISKDRQEQLLNKTGWPIHKPTVDDEIASVIARGGDLQQYLDQRAKASMAKERELKKQKRRAQP